MSRVTSAAGELLTIRPDDSPLKTLFVYGGTALGGYYLFKMFKKDMQQTQAATAQAQQVQTAATNPLSAAAKAARIRLAIGSGWGNTDEAAINEVLWKQVSSKEHLLEIYSSYRTQFGRDLEQDLYNNLDSFASFGKPDWDVVNKRLTYIKCVSRRVNPTTKKTEYVKTCHPMPLNPSMPQ